ncbi:peroxiredoxin [Paenibacillus sp. JCM 10914]|uniref:peroxiredoxin family protein n=1 Tax=Paenibacillus sp. JCM 10914 TaxID=1236974 RepID=UPI000A48496E|nr:redoxin domain-containing protein [Paenibacillus sp. JCM 10914]
MAWRLNRNRNFITIWTQSAWIAGLTFGLSWLLFQSLVGAEGGSAWHLILGIAFLLLLITAWMQFNKPLSEFLTLGLGRNKAVVVVMAALLAWVVVDFTLDRNASNQGHRLSSEEIAEGLKPGLRAPDFILQDQAGHDIRLSQYQGQTVLLNFWASWCPPCKVEMPYMQDFYEKYKQDDVVILSVNMTHLEKSPQDPQTFAMDHGLTFPIVYDEQGSATALYNVVAYPTTYAISPDGIISERFQGAIDEDRMIRAVRKATNHDG